MGYTEYQCPLTGCSYQGIRYRDLTNHIGKWHTGDLEYKCKKCPFVAQRRITLERHQIMHLKLVEDATRSQKTTRSNSKQPLKIKEENVESEQLTDSFDNLTDRE